MKNNYDLLRAVIWISIMAFTFGVICIMLYGLAKLVISLSSMQLMVLAIAVTIAVIAIGLLDSLKH